MVTHSRTNKPVIGITSTLVSLKPGTTGSYVADGYFQGVARCGAIPVIIPLVSDEQVVFELIERVDGVLFSGGEDIGPHWYGEVPHHQIGEVLPLRDRIEISALRYTLQLNKPVLAICRGIQVLNVAMGGSLIQDIPTQLPDACQHMQKAPRPEPSHHVNIIQNTRLHKITGEPRLFTNSFHHQAVKQVAPGFIISAHTDDGVVEAIESNNHNFAVGIQWHPEMMWSQDDIMLKLCEAFVEATQI